MRLATTATARGSAIQATLRYIRETHGPEVLEGITARLDDASRARIESAAMTDEVQYDMLLGLWRVADEMLRSRDARWMEQAGAFAIESVGQQLYGGLLRKSNPLDFVTQSVSLFQLYYAPGDMVCVEVEPGRAVLRLEGFPTASPLFCARQTGGLRRAAELAGGREVRVSHVRCEHEGDAYCEWAIRWASERPEKPVLL